MTARELFAFPNPVNEVSARVVAGGVVGMALLILALRRPWLIAPLAYGFTARALTGPTLSPLGQLATRVVTPRLPVQPKLVAGPRKRFAQSIGAVVTVTALLLALVLRRTAAAYALVGMIAVFATLESAFAYCVGCKVFALLMRLGVIPDAVCAACENMWERRPEAAADAQRAADGIAGTRSHAGAEARVVTVEAGAR